MLTKQSGIGHVVVSDNPALHIYDLQGRKVQHMGKGVYIINGKKVIK